MLLEDLAQLLIDADIGDSGVSLFVGRMPEQPDNAVAIVDYAGRPPEANHSGPTRRFPRVQVQTRHHDPVTARQVADLVWTLYESTKSWMPGQLTIGGTEYEVIVPLSEPFPMPHDLEGRTSILCNYEVRYAGVWGILMHQAAYRWVKTVVGALPPAPTVVEIGGRDINGSVRLLFGSVAYTSLDLSDGPGVDVVADAAVWRPPAPVDVVVCCEVLEHTPLAADLVAAAGEMLRPGGRLILTCATDGRAPHSAVDGGPLRVGEWYRNVSYDELAAWLPPLRTMILLADPTTHDLYALAVKP